MTSTNLLIAAKLAPGASACGADNPVMAMSVGVLLEQVVKATAADAG